MLLTTPPTLLLTRARTSATVTALVALCALAACGGDDSAADTAPTTATASAPTAPPSAPAVETLASTTLATPTLPTTGASTTTASTFDSTAPPASTAPSTVPDTRPVDETAQAMAVAGILAASDFPEPWTTYSEGGELTIDPKACSYRPDGPSTKIARGGAQFGPTMQYGDTGVSSSTFAFPTKSLRRTTSRSSTPTNGERVEPPNCNSSNTTTAVTTSPSR